MKKEEGIYIILENIRSAENVGSIFRTADAVGVSKIYLCGYTPAPLDRFLRENKKIAKTALGAQNYVDWEKCEDSLEVIRDLKGRGVRVVAVEQDERAKIFRAMNTRHPLAFIFGNEIEGVENETLSQSDEIIEIPMMGEKESLNVAVSAGVVLYSVLFI